MSTGVNPRRGVVSRIGTTRFRADYHVGSLRFVGNEVLVEGRDLVGFDAATGRPTRRLELSIAKAFSEDGRLALSLSYEDDCNGLRLVEVPSMATRSCHHGELDGTDYAVSDNGSVVHGCRGGGGELEVLNHDLVQVATIPGAGDGTLDKWTVSADGSVLARVWRRPEYTYELHLFALPGGKPLPVPAVVGAPNSALALSADGCVLAVQRDKDVVVVDRQTELAMSTIPSRGSRMRLSRDGRLLAQVSSSDRDAITVWDTMTGERLWRHALDHFGVFADDLDFTSDGEGLAYRVENVVRVVDARTGHDPSGIGGPVDITSAVLSPDGTLVATSSLGWFALWDASTGAPIRSHRAENLYPLRFSSDGAWVFGIADAEMLVGFAVAGGDSVHNLLPDGCRGERSQPLRDNSAWLLECDDGLAVWRPGSAGIDRRVQLASAESVQAITLDAAGRHAVVVSNELAYGDMPSDHVLIEVIDLATWAVRTQRIAMQAQRIVAALLPDGRVILDHNIVDPATGKTVALGADILMTTEDGRAALMQVIGAPSGIFLWPLDQSPGVPAETTPGGEMAPSSVSTTGRVLECDQMSTCQVRTLR